MANREQPPKIQSWADLKDGDFKVFQCDGCGGKDVTIWEKEGLEHWAQTGPERVCGRYRFVQVYDGYTGGR